MVILHIYVELDLRRTSVNFGSKVKGQIKTCYFRILQTSCHKSKVLCPGFAQVCKTGLQYVISKIFSISPTNDVWVI